MEENTELNFKTVVFSTVTSGERQEDGTWKAVTTTKESYTLLDDTVVEEKVDAMSIDDELSRAVDTATRSTLSFIIENVYKAGFTGLVEYFAFQRQLEEAKKNDNKTKDIQNT